MRIGILTTYFADYGSFAHASALYNFLHSMGYECEFVNECVRYRESVRLWLGYIYDKYLKKLPSSSIVDHNVMLNNYQKIKKELKNYCISEQFSAFGDIKDRYDIVIIGSDELWSLTNKNIRFIPEYFAIGISQYVPTITYATSGITLKQPQVNITKEMVEGLSLCKKIMVRDWVTKRWLMDVANIESVQVLDPALLFPYYVEEAKGEIGIKDYILVYGEYFNRHHINSIMLYAALHQKKLVSVIWPNDWCEMHIDIHSLSELQQYFKCADRIITSTFHGVIFSIANSKQFTAFTEQLRGIKVITLLDDLNLVENSFEFNGFRAFLHNTDYELVNGRIDVMRVDSKNELIDAINFALQK